MEHSLTVCEISILGHSRFFWKIGSDFQLKKSGSGSGVRIGSEKKSLPILTPDPEKSGSGVGSGAVSGVTFSKSGVAFFHFPIFEKVTPETAPEPTPDTAPE